MKIIVDANIVFSAILNSNSKIADVLLNSNKQFEFIAPYFLRHEIKNHHPKLSKISGLSIAEIEESEYQIYRQISFISEEQIKRENWLKAYELTKDVDPNDTPYIAYAKQFKCNIWSGDKALINGLKERGFKKFINTNEIYTMKQKC